MNIPVRNLYYLLCYAWDVLDEAEELDLGDIDSPEVVDLLAKMLAVGTAHALRRGLDREYREVREDASLIRGRIDVQETVKRTLERRRRAAVVYEELSEDTEPNRILKTTIDALIRVKDLDGTIREELVRVYRALGSVTTCRVTSSSFHRVRFHRNNRHYRLLMSVCDLVWENLIPDESTGLNRFRDFVREEHRMRVLFERFVRNFYRREQEKYQVSSDVIEWHGMVKIHDAAVALPRMHTDVVLKSSEELIIIDTKFTSNMTVEHHGTTMLRPEHVYQLSTYLHNAARTESNARRLRAFLLYPATGSEANLNWSLGEQRFGASSINLTNTWPAIRARLLCLIATGSEPDL